MLKIESLRVRTLAMELEAHAATDIGNVRERNEDCHLVDQGRGIFAVADGMGGRMRGDVASQIFIETLEQETGRLARNATSAKLVHEVDQRDRALQSLASVFLEANREIYNTGQGEMGTTGVAVVVAGGAALLAHVGDSRAYLLRDEYLRRLTTDHTYAERRHSTSDEAHEGHRHVLTRTLGGRPHVQVETLFVELQPADRLLLCTDGLSGQLSERELTDHLTGEEAAETADRLVERVCQSGGVDNATALVVDVPDGEGRGFAEHETLETTAKIDALRNIDAFSGLDDRTILQVMRYVYQQDFAESETLIEQGARRHAMYIVISGEVAVRRDGEEIARLGPGEHVGEMALVDDLPRSASVVAVESVRTLAIGPEDFSRMVRRSDPELGNRILWNMLRRCIRRLRRAMADYEQ